MHPVRENIPRKAIIHHTADSSVAPQLEKVNVFHKKKYNFQSRKGSFVAYHFFIERDGAVFQTRDENEEGAHTKSENISSIGICLAGNFDFQTPTNNQRLAMVKILDRILKVWQIPISEIYPHRRFAPTSCYGIQLTDNWAREEYRAYLIANISHILVILKAIIEKLYFYAKQPRK